MAHKDNAAWREANQAAINRTQHELARFAKPTIAFIDGDCVGGGCGIALACDIRVATAAVANRDYAGQAGSGLSAA